jgi:hypothetical protein
LKPWDEKWLIADTGETELNCWTLYKIFEAVYFSLCSTLIDKKLAAEVVLVGYKFRIGTKTSRERERRRKLRQEKEPHRIRQG